MPKILNTLFPNAIDFGESVVYLFKSESKFTTNIWGLLPGYDITDGDYLSLNVGAFPSYSLFARIYNSPSNVRRLWLQSNLDVNGDITGTSFNLITGLASNTPSVPTRNGTIGTGTDAARNDHAHPSELPAGMLAPYAGATAPSGWLLCDGTAKSRTTYADLFTAIGTTYGTGDGSTTFNLPDLRGRVPVGADGDAGRLSANDALGQYGGEEKHTLLEGELAAHKHAMSDGQPPIVYNNASGYGAAAGAGTNVGTIFNDQLPTQYKTGSIGSNTAHNNMQPYLCLNYIIKT
jgi:microcystin-dependent protein